MTRSTTYTANDFDFLIGKWRVRHRTLRERLADSKTWDEAKAIDIVRPAFAGLGNIGRFMRLVDGKPYEGMPTRLFDEAAGVWRIWWLDTMGHRMEPPLYGGFTSGVGHFEGDDELRGQPIRVRFAWTNITDMTARWDQSFSPDEGKTWELNSIMEFARDESLLDNPDFSLIEG